jgi:hypothetical protein
MQKKQAGFALNMISRQYVAYYDYRLITAQFQVAAPVGQSREQLAERFMEYDQLFRLMANSIIVHDQYR